MLFKIQTKRTQRKEKKKKEKKKRKERTTKRERKNAWHNVRGIAPEEMKQAVVDAERIYGDILYLPHPVSEKHPPLSMEAKAAQFSPFSALTGYEEAILETEKLVERYYEEELIERAEVEE